MMPGGVPVDQAVVLISEDEAGATNRRSNRRRKLLGLTILERLILSAHQAGIRDFFLVVPEGFRNKGDLPSPEKDRRFRKDDLRLETIASSALLDFVRRGTLQSRVWVMDGDVVFDPAILTEGGQDDPSSILSVCPGIRLYRLEALAGLAGDLLKQRAARPGSEIRWDRSGAPPPGGLSPKTRFCLKIRSPEDAKRAERYILSTGRKPEDGFMARILIRPVSLTITKNLLKLNLSPNLMTLISSAFGWLSVWLISRGVPRSAVLAGCAFQVAAILDHCDGENARMTFRSSKFGSALDIAGDALVNIFFFLGLPFGLYRAGGQTVWLILGLIVLLSMGLYYFTLIRTSRSAKARSKSATGAGLFSLTREIESQAAPLKTRSPVERLASKIALIYRREFFVTAVLLILLVAGAKVLTVIVSILYPLQSAYVAIVARRRHP